MFWGAESKQNAGRGRTLQTLKPAAATQNKDEENGRGAAGAQLSLEKEQSQKLQTQERSSSRPG